MRVIPMEISGAVVKFLSQSKKAEGKIETGKPIRQQMFNFLLFEMLHTILELELSLAFVRSI